MLFLSVFLISFITFLRTINNFPLRNWDEAWYAEIIKNMANGHYGFLVPFWNGHYYFDKPPLYFWLSLPFFKFFGPGEWQARIISAIAAVLATLLVYLIAKKLFNTTCALISVLVFLTLGQVVIRFAHGNLEALLVCLFLASFYFYLLSEKSRLFAVLTGITIGLGFLTKGWFLGLFPALLITIYGSAITRKLPINLRLIVTSTIISSGWWYALGTIKFGQPFVDWYVLNPGGGLLTSPLQSFSLTYFKDLLTDIGFWFVLLGIFIVLHLRGVRAHLGGVTDVNDKKILYAFGFTTLVFILPLNFLSEKLGWYNLPAYPLVAIVIGYLASKLFETKPKITAFLIVIVTVAQIYNVNRIENIYPDRSRVGSELGKHAKQIIPPEDTIILDDHDFTSFLYYSDHKNVYVVQTGGGKPGEWWVLDYSDLPQFVENKTKTWIITPNINNLPHNIGSLKTEDQYKGYTFISFSST